MLVADDAEIVVNGSDSNKMAVCIKFNIKLNGCFFCPQVSSTCDGIHIKPWINVMINKQSPGQQG